MSAESRDWRRDRPRGGGRAHARAASGPRAHPPSSPRPPPAPPAPPAHQAPNQPPRTDAAPVRGKCDAMCSETERRERDKHMEISRFERLDGGVLAVKKYRRAAAGSTLEPGEVRPPRVLLATLRHLFLAVLPWPGGGLALDGDAAVTGSAGDFLALYEFLSDRIRSVRQDFTVQHVEDASLETALEQIARFYALAGLRADQLLDRSGGDGVVANWSDKLHDEQLASALAQLQALYRGQHASGGAAALSDAALDRQAAMVALDLLLRLDDARGVALTLRRLPARLRGRPRVRRAMAAFVALQLDDFRGFLARVEAMTVLEQALALRQLPRVWASAVRMLNKAFGKQDRVGLSELGAWLWLARDGEDLAAVEQLCVAMNVHVEHVASVQTAAVMEKPASVDSWEQQGGDSEATISKAPAPPPTAFVRFKVSPLNVGVDTKEAKRLVRAVALRRVLPREIAGGKSAGELVVDGEA